MEKTETYARRLFASLRTQPSEGCSLVDIGFSDGSSKFKLFQGKKHEERAQKLIDGVYEKINEKKRQR